MRFWQSVRPAVFDDMPCVVVSYEDDAVFQDITAQKLFGVSGFEGRLPVSASTALVLVPAYRPRHPAFSAMMLPKTRFQQHRSLRRRFSCPGVDQQRVAPAVKF